MKELNPLTYPVREEMEPMTYSTLDFDLILGLLEADFVHSPPPPPPNESPAEEGFDPQQPPTEGDMPHGAAPFGQRQPALRAPGFHAASTDFPLLPPFYAPAKEGFDPQQPPTGGDMLHGAAPFGLRQPALSAPGPAPPMYHPPTARQPSYMHPAAPCRQRKVKNVPVTTPWGQETSLTPLGFINGQIVYGLPTYTAPPVAPDVPVVKAHALQKRKFCRKPDHENKPYVKKPPNAFMIFRTEQRPTVVAELHNKNCATVNRLIGQRWKSLPKEEQAKYYEHADREKQLHSQLFPEWSAGDNYGQKKKRIRRKGPVTAYSAAM
ncbi:transcription factor 7-like 1 [Hippoglossus hippoglossus]|uniref:transcription factor 7-like 1 n=1 Tax=Hippoglossus hippoglossus TaxID=8267 RepID=UPI00148B86F5|nr:transcription factor 7-like 1 [Hippoglossus hippoglossus]